jgi:hypothetical protein
MDVYSDSRRTLFELSASVSRVCRQSGKETTSAVSIDDLRV